MGEIQFRNGYLDIPRENYHDPTGHVSFSMLKTFQDSVRAFHGRYVTKTLEKPEATKAMDLGNALHMAILEPDRFASSYIVAPRKYNRRSSKERKERDELAEANLAHGQILLEIEDWDQIASVVDQIEVDKAASELLCRGGENERPIQWQDPETGIWCKSCMDRLIDQRICVDLKFVADPSPAGFARLAGNLSYHGQDAFYRDGVEVAFGNKAQFYFVVIGKEPPHVVAVYEMDLDSVLLGRAVNRASLQRLKHCRDFDQWDEPTAHKVVRLQVPRYHFPRDWQYQAEDETLADSDDFEREF